jgi:hypothetical protein
MDLDLFNTHILKYLIIIHSSAITNSRSMQFTIHAIKPLSLLSHTSLLVLASNGEISPSWVPELSLPNSYSDPQCTLNLLELPSVVQICTVWSSSNK